MASSSPYPLPQTVQLPSSSSMANPLKPHFPIQKPNHSPSKPNPIMRSTKFFLKSILCALFLFSLPLFPSKAPDFIADTALTKFWELLHLLFIGIAVSYGLFSRRSVSRPIESNTEPPGSQSTNFLSIFDELYDEKPTRVHPWRSSISQGESAFGVSTDEKLKPDSFDSKNGAEIMGPVSEKNTVQSWNSQYLQCQPMIVVAKPNCSLGDEFEKPLGLPIRSLRSRIVDPTRPKPRERSGSSSRSNSMDSMKSSDRESSKNMNFGDLGPLNLEQKFDETVPLPSPVPWRSGSGGMEMMENLSAIKQPLHSRHLSAEESQFQNNKSFRSNSNASSMSNQSTVTSCSQNGVSELKVGKEKLDQSASVDSFFELNADFNEKDLWGQFSGQEEFNSMKNGLNGHQYSKSLSDFGNGGAKTDELEGEVHTNGDRSSKGDSNGLAWISRRENSSQKRKASILRGKSVRTFRQRAEAKRTEQTHQDLVRESHAHDSRTKQILEKSCSDPRQSFCNENFKAEAEVVDCVSDAGSEAYEVDKKAGEFIAKFREQIRLQKTGSIDGSVSLDIDQGMFI